MADKCDACGQKLDPILAASGLHIGCRPDAPATLRPTADEVLGVDKPSGYKTADEVRAVLHARIGEAIADYCKHRPRDTQKRIGPSEIGLPCDRRLAYKLLDWPRVNHGGDPFPSFVGTAVHAELEKVFSDARRMGRYATELPVTVRPGLDGSLDLFDVVDGIVVDHKVVGETSMRHYKHNGPSKQYRTQVHAYGKGAVAAGHDVAWVAIVFYPRGGNLEGRHVWVEAFDPTIANAALERLDNVLCLVDLLDVEGHPENWQHVPADTTNCRFCPWFKPGSTNLAEGCPGGGPTRRAANVLDGLVA